MCEETLMVLLRNGKGWFRQTCEATVGKIYQHCFSPKQAKFRTYLGFNMEVSIWMQGLSTIYLREHVFVTLPRKN